MDRFGAAGPASRDRPAGRGRGLLRVLDAVEATRVRKKPGPVAGAVGGGRAAGPARRLRRLYDGRPRGRELRAVLVSDVARVCGCRPGPGAG